MLFLLVLTTVELHLTEQNIELWREYSFLAGHRKKQLPACCEMSKFYGKGDAPTSASLDLPEQSFVSKQTPGSMFPNSRNFGLKVAPM